MKETFIVGTRGSKLALTQTSLVINMLKDYYPQYEFVIKTMTTQGDRLANVSLDKIGGKGVFVKEIEEALLNGDIDMAIHSVKDMPAKLPTGLTLGAIPAREDPRDVLVSSNNYTLENLPTGSIIGTSSKRREIQIKRIRPDVITKSIRGNVDTRIKKMESGQYDGIILAAAGLNRLDIQHIITEHFPCDIFIPSVGQGALGVQVRTDEELTKLVKVIDDFKTRVAVESERAFLKTMNGNCRIPVGAYAHVKGDDIVILGLLVGQDEKKVVKGEKTGSVDKTQKIGKELALELINKLGTSLDEWKNSIQ